MSFDWKTEDLDWNGGPRRSAQENPATDEQIAPFAPEFESAQPEPAPPRSRRRNFLFAAATTLLLLLIVGILYQQIARRTEEGRRRAEEDVLASLAIVRDAAAEGDSELLVGFLSGRDPQWAMAQTELMAGNDLNDRSNFGFMPIDLDGAAATTVVNLSPDLNSAEISILQDYAVAIGSGLTETIPLSQTVIFRRGPDRWLLSPPEPDYWGETVTIDGRHVRVTYPRRDNSIAQRLSRDVEAVMADLCADFNDGCPPVQLELSTDPTTLNHALSPELEGVMLSITLPAPSLFGIPTNDAGNRAISRRYVESVVTATVRDYTGWTCCENDLLYSALNDASLSRHGLLTWPVTPEKFEPVLQHPHPLDTVAEMWQENGQPNTGDESGLLQPFVIFLVQEARTLPIVEMQRLLVGERSPTFWDWLSAVTGNRYPDAAAFLRDWLQYSTRQYPSQPGVAFPDQDLQLICRTPGALRASLYRYDPEMDVLSLEHDLAALDSPMLAPLPDRSGVAVFSRGGRENGTPPHLWRDGRVLPVTFEDESVTDFVPLPPEPGADGLTFFLDSAASPAPFAVLPLEQCNSAGACLAHMVLGLPEPSPDRSHSIFVVGAQTPLLPNRYQPLLYLGDEQGNNINITGHGWSPFWIDAGTFGFITTPQETGRQAIVLIDHGNDHSEGDGALSVTIAHHTRLPLMQPNVTGGTTGTSINEDAAEGEKAELLLTVDDLVNRGLLVAGTTVMFDRVLSDQQGENLFIFTANPLQPDVPGLAVLYKLFTGEVETLFEIPDEPFDYRRTYRFSPDGRWLVVGSMRTDEHWSIFLHNLDTGNTIEHALSTGQKWPADWLIDWSSDGRWLAIITSGYVRLVAPDETYSMPLVFDGIVCTAGAWINKG